MPRLVDVMGRPHTGVVPFAVVAIVTDNVDPDKLGRIKVKFPTLTTEPESFWIRQSSPNAGKERGLYALPEKEDEVLVLFMQGSQDVGVIIGQFWNGVDKPPFEALDKMPGSGKTGPLERSKDKFSDGSTDHKKNDRRFWKSRSGHLFVFDDTSGKETVQIWDKSHTLAFVFDSKDSRILLTNSKGDIHIRAKNDLFLEAGNDFKYTVKNNMDGLVHNDWKLKVDMNMKAEAGMKIEEKAGTEFKAEAGTNFTAKAGVNFKAEGSVAFDAKGGATAKIEGSGMCTVKGGVVMIN